MAGRIAYYGNIATQGLVLDLDAAIQGSYPKTGSTWFDISNNGNNGTLTNGPLYTGSDYGAIVFDGVNDYVDCGNGSAINTPDNVTINIWFKINSLAGTWQGIIAKRISGGSTNYGINFNGSSNLFQWYFNTTGNFRILSTSISGNFTTNVWYNVCSVFEKSGSNTNGYIYKNGTLLTSNILSDNIATISTPLNLGISYTGQEPFNGNISSVQIYNRALSATEITQNFNALRGRYGI